MYTRFIHVIIYETSHKLDRWHSSVSDLQQRYLSGLNPQCTDMCQVYYIFCAILWATPSSLRRSGNRDLEGCSPWGIVCIAFGVWRESRIFDLTADANKISQRKCRHSTSNSVLCSNSRATELKGIFRVVMPVLFLENYRPNNPRSPNNCFLDHPVSALQFLSALFMCPLPCWPSAHAILHLYNIFMWILNEQFVLKKLLKSFDWLELTD